jgi:hypothetical protein
MSQNPMIQNPRAFQHLEVEVDLPPLPLLPHHPTETAVVMATVAPHLRPQMAIVEGMATVAPHLRPQMVIVELLQMVTAVK